MGITAAYTSGSQGLQVSPESPGSTSHVAEDVTNMYRTIAGPTIFTSGFLGVTCIYRRRVYTAPSGYRCRIYNAVSRSTLQVSQGLAGIIRGLESTLQIAKSYKHEGKKEEEEKE